MSNRIFPLLCTLTILLSSCELFRTPTRTKPVTRTVASRTRTPARGTPHTGNTAQSYAMTKKAAYNPKAVRYSNQTVNDLINTARSYGGTNYHTGGGTSVGLDCSGLVQVSFRQIGVKMPRTAAEQSTVGESISMRQLRPGDLVFFNTDFKGTGSSRINHTGIITSVRNDQDIMFIHASSSRGVIEDNLFNDFWQRGFIKATRILIL
ncbi:MAG: C40 family peptidase, partial [Siphonobacter sp.]